MKIEGTVVKGKQLGRTIGFPTANLQADSVPQMENGVYAAWFELDGSRLPCMLNIGHHPTVPEGAPTIEAHIFDFEGDIYGRRAVIDTAAFLRSEQKFPSVDALRQQLSRDRERALEILHNDSNSRIK